VCERVWEGVREKHIREVDRVCESVRGREVNVGERGRCRRDRGEIVGGRVRERRRRGERESA
jgi:hypothetical protein